MHLPVELGKRQHNAGPSGRRQTSDEPEKKSDRERGKKGEEEGEGEGGRVTRRNAESIANGLL